MRAVDTTLVVRLIATDDPAQLAATETFTNNRQPNGVLAQPRGRATAARYDRFTQRLLGVVSLTFESSDTT